MKDEFFTLMNLLPGRVGDELPRPPDDIHTFWRNWITRGSFAWETDGWPYWSHLSNVQSWWNFRHLPNIRLFHYNDMLENTEREVRRMAAFLEIDVSENTWADIIQAVSFAEMKRQGDLYAPGGGHFWKGGAQTFLHKGTNGRWREVLSDKEITLYEAACDRALTFDCRVWLESGGTI
jgi:aryl sulfotransferase